jgi:hypothetical protein
LCVEEALKLFVDPFRRLLVGVVADAGDLYESTARRISATAFHGIGQNVRVAMTAQMQQWDVESTVHQLHKPPALAT